MAKRIFTSFAIEDERTRDLFVGQARAKKVPYDLGVIHGSRAAELKLGVVMEL